MSWKDAVQTLAQRAGYDIVRHRPTIRPTLDLLGLMIRDALTDDFLFVQVGANDGLRDDPLRPHILAHRLRGLLIEPLPDLFASLRQNYADAPGLCFENCAVGDEAGTLTIYRVRPDAPLPDFVQGLASFDRARVSARYHCVPGLDEWVEPVEVPVSTLRTLLTKHQMTHPSLLLVDAEGWDARIVAHALADGLRPDLIVYEHVHLSAQAQADCLRALGASNYAFAEVGINTYARHGAT